MNWRWIKRRQTEVYYMQPIRLSCLTSVEETGPLSPKHGRWSLTWVHKSIHLSIITQVQLWPTEDVELIINKQPHKVMAVHP